MAEELYRAIPGYAGYLISESGVLLMTAKCKKWGGVPRHGSPNKDGYFRVSVTSEGKRKKFFVHRLVAMAFIGDVPDGMEVNHVDGNKTNNHFSNLEIVSHKANMHHAIGCGLWKPSNGSGEDNPNAKLSWEYVVLIREKFSFGETCSSLGRMFGVSHQAIREIVLERTWKHEQLEK